MSGDPYRDKKGNDKKATEISELKNLAHNKTDFTESDIEQRTALILDTFIDYLDAEGLLEA